jgi:UDP-N-acetylmuramoyl-tripeptide--D-alanyl-D-alanine ligase
MPEQAEMNEIPIKILSDIIKAEPSDYNLSPVAGISIDSRTTKTGDCFFAIKGDHFDGHDFLIDAFANGAVCAVVSNNNRFKIPADKTILKVDDCIKALGELAREYRRQNNFKVIAITGSVGKTTTRQIIYHVLSRHFQCRSAPKNFNNNIGLPLTLLAATVEDDIVVSELGTNHPGEIAYLSQIAFPDIAVITNVCPAHLEGLNDIETIANEKSSIVEGMKSDGTLIINGDIDLLVETCRSKKIEFTTFGQTTDCDVKVSKITHKSFSSRFNIDGTEIFLPLPGVGNIENAAVAWAVCRCFGITINDFADAVKTLCATAMRAQPLQIGNLTVINDCYNANPASMKNALDILTGLDSDEGRRFVFICGDMAELGKFSESLHADLGLYISKTDIKLLLTIGEYAKITAQSAKSNSKHHLQTKSFKDTLSACNNLKDYVKDSDIVLVKGSRTAGLESVIEKLKELFL